MFEKIENMIIVPDDLVCLDSKYDEIQRKKKEIDQYCSDKTQKIIKMIRDGDEMILSNEVLQNEINIFVIQYNQLRKELQEVENEYIYLQKRILSRYNYMREEVKKYESANIEESKHS